MTSTTPPPRKGPTHLGGKADPATAPAPIRPPIDINADVPPDVRKLLEAAEAAQAQRDADPLASKLAVQQANQGDPNRRVAEPFRGSGAQVSVANLLRAGPRRPEDDLYNPGWRIPRYFYLVIRLLAFQCNADQQEVATELMYAALTNTPPGGVLRGVAREDIAELVRIAYGQAAQQLGTGHDDR